jgi:hypothetical protein
MRVHAVLTTTCAGVITGSVDNVTAEAIEAAHLRIKADFAMTNQKEGWQVQVLLRAIRQVQAEAASRIVGGRDGVDGKASSLHNYQWAIVEHWQETAKVLGARVMLKSVRKALTLDLASLALPSSIWRVRDAHGDIRRLPYALAKYVQDALHETVEGIPTPSAAPLDLDTLHGFLRHVRPYHLANNAGEKFAEIVVFSHIRIEHPTTNTHVRLPRQACAMCAGGEHEREAYMLHL